MQFKMSIIRDIIRVSQFRFTNILFWKIIENQALFDEQYLIK